MMSGFQIPGLTTLSQPSAAAAAAPIIPGAATAAPEATETHQDDKAATKSPDSVMVDRPDSIQDSRATTVDTSTPKHAENILEDTSQSIAIDQTETHAQTQDIPLETTSNGTPGVQDQNQDESTEKAGDAPTEAPPSPPSLTSGLEALLGGLDPVPVQPDAPTQNEENSASAEANGAQEHPEWEEDSSPLESSSEESSSDSDDDSDDDKDYPILGPEETARLLMEMEGGSDDEGEGRARNGGGSQVRTKNELPEEVIPVPDIKLGPDAKIVELGNVEHIVENTIVVCANTTGEYQVLDSGSAIFTEDRTVIAAVADLLGSVRQPRYTARFTNAEQIAEYGLQLGSKLFYSPDHATYIFTQALQGEKGTDASNWHDEEAGDEEMEFSDDEKEAEYKRQQKAKKRAARGGKDGGRGGAKPSEPSYSQPPVALKYDDDDDDGPYKPLARPASFGQGPPPHSVETGYNYSSNRGGHNNRGRGRGSRGRGNRGGQRGAGGGGGGGRGGGFSLPPRPQGQSQNQHRQPQHQQQPQYQQHQPQPHQPQPQPPQQNFNFPFGQAPQFPFPWPPNMAGIPPQPPPPIPLPLQFAGQQQQQQQPAGAGMFFNPAFYSAGADAQWPGQQGQGQGQGQGHQGR